MSLISSLQNTEYSVMSEVAKSSLTYNYNDACPRTERYHSRRNRSRSKERGGNRKHGHQKKDQKLDGIMYFNLNVIVEAKPPCLCNILLLDPVFSDVVMYFDDLILSVRACCNEGLKILIVRLIGTLDNVRCIPFSYIVLENKV